jgi:phosphoesterase RecJ-like protein
MKAMKAVNNSLGEIAAELQKGGPLLLASHIMPDGDSVGSLIGLGMALKNAGHNVVMYSPDGVPDRYSFLGGAGEVVSGGLPDSSFRLAVVLDCSDHLRLKPAWPKLKTMYLINIDHHSTNQYFGRLNHVDTAAAATGEIIWLLLNEMGMAPDKAVADALYVAIATDTGSFRYEGTGPRCHRAAAALLEAGVKPQEISPRVFDLKSREAVAILRVALTSLQFSRDGRIAWMVAAEKDMQETGARDEHLEGVVNYAKNIEGVEVGLLFREKHDGTVKVGFRSHRVNVAEIARTFGGGGHPRAAGCSLETKLSDAVNMVLTALEQERDPAAT